MNYDVIVIGAGPAGMTAALKLAEKGHSVLILEKAGNVGGLCQSLQLWGQLIDLGPHRFFSCNRQVIDLWTSMAPGYHKVKRITRICYRNKFFKYPLEVADTLLKLGIIEATLCLISYVVAQTKQTNNNNFEGWVKNRFGSRLFNTFFREYSEKLWGIKCDQIHSDFAVQRIKNFSLIEAIKNALGSKTKHKTAVDEFAYPALGTGQVYNNMKAKFQELNGSIVFYSTVATIDPFKKLVETTNGIQYHYRHVISTMPLTSMAEKIPSASNTVLEACGRLHYRNTVLIYILVEKSPFPDNWIYVHSPEVKVGRITNFSNWGTEQKQTILCLEYWCNNSDKEWGWVDKEWELNAEEELKKLALKIGNILNSKILRIPKSYPIYDISYKKNMLPIKEFLQQFPEIIAIGRYGSFRYNNQDHSILMGLLAAENINSGSEHNLWNVNEDKSYQEAHKPEI